jgi:copper resistance protein C
MSVFRFVIAGLCAAALLSPVSASAHAHLDHSNPAAGSVLSQAPKEVTIWFTEALEPKFSSIVVQNAKGVAMQSGAAHLAAGNTAQFVVPLKPLTPGTYKVIWKALSVDTHRTKGDFSFRVGP